MRFLIRNNIVLLIIIILYVLSPTHLAFAKISPIKPNLVFVPKYQTQKAQEQLVANLVTQKFFLSLKKYQEYKEEYDMSFVFTAPAENEKPAQLATYYFEQDYTNVVIVNTQYDTNTEKYNVVIDFFYLGKKVENLKTISFSTAFEDVLNALHFLDIVKPEIFNSITQKFSQMLTLFSRIYRRATIVFNQDEDKNTKPYFLRINGVMVEKPSPKKIVIYAKKNFIEILQEDDSQKKVNIGSFVISPTLNEYNVIINKQPEKAQATKSFSKSKTTFLNSLVTTNFLLGYSYQVLSNKLLNSPHMLSGTIRITISPKVPLLALGIEVPFITDPKEKSQDDISFLGLTALVSGIFPIAKNMEAIIHGGGGFFSISKLKIHKKIGRAEKDSQIQPQGGAGLGLAYNIPIKEAGYIRILLNINTTFSLLKNVNYLNSNQRDVLQSSQKFQSTNSLLFINTLFGVGIRF